MSGTLVREASGEDVPLILSFIRELAEYENLSHEVVATEETLRANLFGGRQFAEVLIAEHDGDRRASPCSSTTSRRSSASRAFTWRTFT
jgi:hypothetical protein